jgi:hypothetical protein
VVPVAICQESGVEIGWFGGENCGNSQSPYRKEPLALRKSSQRQRRIVLDYPAAESYNG